MRPVNRIQPVGPVQAYKTYAVSSPIQTHWRPATCAEVDCGAHLNGWTTTVDESTDLGQGQAHYIRRESRRRFTEERLPGGLTKFTFEAGQACFRASDHKAPLGRPEIYVVRGGDWRGSTGVIRRHTRPEFWTEDFAEHQQRIADAQAKG